MAALNHHAPGRDRRERRAKLLRSNKVGQAAPPAHPASRPSFSGSGGQLTAPAATARERRQVITQQQGGTGGAACPSGIATQLRTGPRPQGSGGKLLRSNKVGQAVPPAHPASRPPSQEAAAATAPGRDRKGAEASYYAATRWGRRRHLPIRHRDPVSQGAEANSPRTEPRPQGSGGPSYYAATRWDRRRRLPIRHRDPASQGAEAKSLGTSPQS
jgi:hypothetical protein